MSQKTRPEPLIILRSWKPLDVAFILMGGIVLLLIISGLLSLTSSENLADLFAFDTEGNVVTWYAILLWLFLAVILRLASIKFRLMSEPQMARASSVFAYLALFFAIDEASGLSLKIRLILLDFGAAPENLDQDQVWLFMYGLMVVLIVAVAIPGLIRISNVSRKFVIGLAVGGVTLVASGLGLELTPSLKALPYEPVFEETFELIAVVIMIWGTLHGLGSLELVEPQEIDP